MVRCVFVLAAFALCAGFVAGQFDPMVMMQVQQEEMVSRRYTEATLKFQRSRLEMTAASLWLQLGLEELYPKAAQPDSAASFLEVARPANEDFDDDVNVDSDRLDDNDKRRLSSELLASYNLLSAVGVQSYQTIFQAGDLQREFFMDRVLTLRAQATPNMPPQLLQLLYVKQYITTLKTMRLAIAFQTITAYKTWLEDALDVFGDLVTDPVRLLPIFKDHEDDLVRHRLWAFTSFNSLASLDLQTMYLEWYMESMLASMFGGGQQTGTAFVEEQVQEGEEAEAQASPFIGAPALYNPAMMVRMYKMYHTMYQAHAASSALHSAVLDAKATHLYNDGDGSNDDEAETLSKQATQLFTHGFAQSMLVTSQLDAILAMVDFYSIMQAPAAPPPS